MQLTWLSANNNITHGMIVWVEGENKSVRDKKKIIMWFMFIYVKRLIEKIIITYKLGYNIAGNFLSGIISQVQ